MDAQIIEKSDFQREVNARSTSFERFFIQYHYNDKKYSTTIEKRIFSKPYESKDIGVYVKSNSPEVVEYFDTRELYHAIVFSPSIMDDSA